MRRISIREPWTGDRDRVLEQEPSVDDRADLDNLAAAVGDDREDAFVPSIAPSGVGVNDYGRSARGAPRRARGARRCCSRAA